MKCGEFVDQVSEYELQKKDSAPWDYVTEDFSFDYSCKLPVVCIKWSSLNVDHFIDLILN
jgi:hypothetical protein